MQIDCFGQTDIGRKRETNQDQYLIADLQRSLTLCDTSLSHEKQQRLIGNSPGKLLVVADGLGGPAGGERASEIALNSLSEYVLNVMYWFLKLSDDQEDELFEELASSLSVCEEDVRNHGRQHPKFKAMGTTVTLAYIVWPRMYVVHAGDSRLYVSRGEQLVQVTRDHSMAQAMVSAGAMKPEEMKTSRMRHLLCNAVGGKQDVYADVHRVMLHEGDIVLLCTDGLHSLIDEATIREQIEQPRYSSEQITKDLISVANQAGGYDNITAITAKFDASDSVIDESEAIVPISAAATIPNAENDENGSKPDTETDLLSIPV